MKTPRKAESLAKIAQTLGELLAVQREVFAVMMNQVAKLEERNQAEAAAPPMVVAIRRRFGKKRPR